MAQQESMRHWRARFRNPDLKRNLGEHAATGITIKIMITIRRCLGARGLRPPASSSSVRAMNFGDALNRAVVAAAVCAALTGCTPPPAGTADEAKDPHYLRGQALLTELNHSGAIDAFEKALENNPRSAAAHFELGFLYEDEKKGSNPAAAIHHFESFLKLRPKSDRADIVKDHITGCKMELAKTLLLTTGAPSVQQQIDRLKSEIERLTLENGQLRRQLESAGMRASQSVTQAGLVAKSGVLPPAANGPEPTRSTKPAPAPETPKKAVAAAPASRTHSIKQGEFPATIARQYGVKLEDLLAANPGLDPKRLKIGQTINIPAQ